MRKKHELEKKPLTLDKSTIREISSRQMTIIAGGRMAATGSDHICC